MYEISKQLEILFTDQKSTTDFKAMMDELESVADEARNVSGDENWKVYSALKQCQYEYLNVLSEYVPKLLANEKFLYICFLDKYYPQKTFPKLTSPLGSSVFDVQVRVLLPAPRT